MMTLKIQILTLLVSIGFGFIFSLFIDLIHTHLFRLKPFWQAIISFFLILSSAIIYFLILLKLNNAIIHPYYILAFGLGFFIEIGLRKLFKKIILWKKNINKKFIFHK